MANESEAFQSHAAITSTDDASRLSLISSSTTMNTSFVLSPTRQFAYEKRPLTPLPTPRHVRVRIIATGLCGSDVCVTPSYEALPIANVTSISITGNMDALADTWWNLL